ncbi:MAG: tRNA (guanine(46)-N(7))-methyltransferase TrmB [Planctomycetota bacterium]|jgi:tRNA (guanine-N7-)-methyltransferase
MSYSLSRSKPLVTEGYGIGPSDLPPFGQGRVDPRNWYEHPRRRFEIEVGSGKGTFLVQQSAVHSDVNFLGLEKAAVFYRYAADRFRRHGLTNVRILRMDAAEFIRFWCADAVAAVIHLYFSDPWPKKRHHKRRLIQDRTLVEWHRVLQPGGELRLVTDHDDLWAWYQDHASHRADLFERCPIPRTESAGAGEIVGSNYERKYRREGRPFHGMKLTKRSDAATEQGGTSR